MCTSGVMGAEYKLHIMQQAANISLQRNSGSFTAKNPGLI